MSLWPSAISSLCSLCQERPSRARLLQQQQQQQRRALAMLIFDTENTEQAQRATEKTQELNSKSNVSVALGYFISVFSVSKSGLTRTAVAAVTPRARDADF